ncbi:hypothetical protein, partial [Acidithiobacillus ferrooxidans]|uniref:hypothetical protein n=1 Tax=Acidithiobacillus ferrooxidans TaxID=920 RepID=UPI00214722BB
STDRRLIYVRKCSYTRFDYSSQYILGSLKAKTASAFYSRMIPTWTGQILSTKCKRLLLKIRSIRGRIWSSFFPKVFFYMAIKHDPAF